MGYDQAARSNWQMGKAARQSNINCSILKVDANVEARRHNKVGTVESLPFPAE